MNHAIIRPKKLPDAKKRVFCFSHAGGSASSFVPWAKELAPELELCAVQLPGRGPRIAEPNITRAEDLIEELAVDLEPMLDKPYIFFGHSMGSLLSFELARLFRHEAWPMPERIIVSAFVAPQDLGVVTRVGGELIHELPEEKLVAFLKGLGSKSSAAFDDPELRALVLPAMRADFELLADYRCYEEAPLDVPLIAVAGRHDPLATPALVEPWRVHAHEFQFIVRDTGHFMIEDDVPFLFHLIRSA